MWQAVRPAGLSFATAQGKGCSPLLARISAAMESVEGAAADTPPPAAARASWDQLRGDLEYALDELDLHPGAALDRSTTLDWLPAARAGDGSPSWVPRDLVNVDYTAPERWSPPTFRATSNGLAAGNVPVEAVLHGLYELIERDALARIRSRQTPMLRIRLDTVGGSEPLELLERYEAADVEVSAYHLPSPTGIATCYCEIWSRDFRLPAAGSGTHLDSGVALSRALSECAQSRLTQIAGARDDLVAGTFGLVDEGPGANPRAHEREAIAFDALPSRSTATLEGDLRLVVGEVERVTGRQPLTVDLTSAKVGVPVVRCLAPGLRFAERH